MAPRSLPRSQAAHAKIAESIRNSDGSYSLQKFKKLPNTEKIAVLNKCWDGVHDYFTTGRLTKSSYYDLDFLTDAMHEVGFDVASLRQFLNPIRGYSGSTKLLQGLDKFKQKVSDSDLLASIDEWETAVRSDPLFYTSKGTHHGRPLEEYQKNGIDIDSVDPRQYDALGTRVDSTSKGTPVNPETPAEPSVGALTDKPLNNASPAETSGGILTDPSVKLPENSIPANADTNVKGSPVPKDAPEEGVVVGPETPITPVGDSAIPAGEKPAASLSPGAIGEAMRDAVKDQVGNTQLNSEDIPAFLVKEKGEVKTETAAETKTPETPKEGALTGKDKKPAESSKGMLSRMGDFIRNNKGKILGWGLGTPFGFGIAGAAIYDLASDDSTLKSLFRGDYPTSIPNAPSATQPRNEPATNEEYTPGKIPSHIPQDNLTSIKESTTSKKIKNQPQQQKQQPQVVNAPVNNATADYVRAAYDSYIPSDAGRAYQKAIYGDPLELERNKQQQKWRDFVMRSGQSPAELVQRGLMPYDALQYI